MHIFINIKNYSAKKVTVIYILQYITVNDLFFFFIKWVMGAKKIKLRLTLKIPWIRNANIFTLKLCLLCWTLCKETHREGLQTAAEKTFQNSLSTGTRDSCTIVRSSSRHRLPVWAELTPRRARAQTLAHRRPSSAAWAEEFAELLAWQSATSLRQRRTYGPLSPRRCCSPWSWQSSPSRGTRSFAGRMEGYLDIRAAVTCNLLMDIKSYYTANKQC